MVYSDVINNNWHKILPHKKKYIKQDIDKVYIASFFDSNLNNGRTFTDNEARFVVLCTAIFYEAETSNYIANYHAIKEKENKKEFLNLK